jgi:MAP7 domain-containing protein 1
MDEEGRRLVEDQEYARRRAAERLAAEQRRREEAEAKRLADEKRRREEAAARMARMAEEEQQRALVEEERKRKEEEAAAAKRAVQLKMSSAKDVKSASGPVLTGNVTVQTSSSMYWRRRYFELSTTRMTFYKSPEDHKVLDSLELRSTVRAINETFEGLQAILHSFALEFDDDGPWLFYADSAVDKDLLVGTLRQLTGL